MLLALIINPHAANNLAVGENPKLKTNQRSDRYLAVALLSDHGVLPDS